MLLAFVVAALGGYVLFTMALTSSSELKPSRLAASKRATGTQQQQAAQQQTRGAQQRAGKDFSSAQAVLASRVCGSPAVDGYAHVEPPCLEQSPTNQWYIDNKPGPEDMDIYFEKEADYDGMAVGWGIGNTKQSVEECGEACRQHKPSGDGAFGKFPCNAFAFCAFETCFEPDAHDHSKGDCWLKFTEGPASPEVNMRGALSKGMRKRHPDAPERVQWHSGVVLPHGVKLTNGSWSPRHDW